MKPTAMLVDALLDLTDRGDIVHGPVPRLRLDPDRRRKDQSRLSRRRTRSALCRRDIRRYEAATHKTAVLVETVKPLASLHCAGTKNSRPEIPPSNGARNVINE